MGEYSIHIVGILVLEGLVLSVGNAQHNKFLWLSHVILEVGVLKLLVLNTQQDCVIDELELSPCSMHDS